MQGRSFFIVVPILTAALACNRSMSPTSPSADAAGLGALAIQGGSKEQHVNMLDACDPETFNAAVGPGTCARPGGGVTFQHFIDQLTKHGTIGSWRFTPLNATLHVGDEFVALNQGGETHTFTEVEEFGGGVVPVLNQLAGVPTPAPECLKLKGTDFIAPGGTARDDADEAGNEKYQCCIHPWMRLEAKIREK